MADATGAFVDPGRGFLQSTAVILETAGGANSAASGTASHAAEDRPLPTLMVLHRLAHKQTPG
jgi:hypothetical protein